ncbi:MAG: hypothetical protein AB7H66_11565 [Hyphomonadaceae bacterium]
MKTSFFLPIAALAVSAAIAACAPATQESTAQTSAEQSVATTPAAQPAIQRSDVQPESTERFASPSSVVGEYTGDFDGGSGTVTITGAPGRYHAALRMSDTGCFGEIAGPAREDARGNLTIAPSDGDGCTVRLTRTANGLDVEEDSCTSMHGAACAFSGSVERTP